MTFKDEIRAYRERWKAVEEVQAEVRRTTSIELLWRQLNAAYGIAKGLGLLQYDSSEMEVFERWAMLKEKMINRSQTSGT